MRKITSEAIAAFNEARPYKKGNTEVKIFANEGYETFKYLLLHGNRIAWFKHGHLHITNARMGNTSY